VGSWLLCVLGQYDQGINPQQATLLDIDLDEELHLPIVWLVTKTLSIICSCRMDKKPCTLFNTRATLKASIMLLLKQGSKLQKNFIQLCSALLKLKMYRQ